MAVTYLVPKILLIFVVSNIILTLTLWGKKTISCKSEEHLHLRQMGILATANGEVVNLYLALKMLYRQSHWQCNCSWQQATKWQQWKIFASWCTLVEAKMLRWLQGRVIQYCPMCHHCFRCFWKETPPPLPSPLLRVCFWTRWFHLLISPPIYWNNNQSHHQWLIQFHVLLS